MTPRLARSLLALLLATSSVTWAQQTPPAPATGPSGAPPPKPEEELVSFTLPDVDIDTVLSLIEQYTGKFIIRPAALPTAQYNLKINKKIPKSEAVLYLQTVLSLNRIAIIPLGERALKVVDITSARTEAPELITGSAFDQPASGKIATKMFQLDFMRVADFFQMVQTMLNPNLQGIVQLQTANAAIVTDTVSNLQRIELMVKNMDRPNIGANIKYYSLKSSKASELQNKIRGIITGTLQQQLGQSTTFSADDRTNQLILVADPRLHPFFDELIDKLDGAADPNTRNDVLSLKHADAVEVQTLLSTVINGQTAASQRTNSQSIRPGQITTVTPGVPTAPGAAPAAPVPTMASLPSVDALAAGSGANEFSSLATVVADKRSNSIVVSGTANDLRLIRNLVDKLDIILAQVRLEVVIAEVTLDDNKATGIGSLGLKVDGDKLIGFGPFSIAGIGASALQITNGVITRPGGNTTVSGPRDLAGEILINSTPRKNNTNILSNPTITTTHNKEAMFFFGETRPTISGVTSAATGSTTGGLSTQSNIQQQEIGTRVTVTPLIGNDLSVQLKIVQEISDVTGEVTVDSNTQYIIGKRNTSSYITAHSGETYVLAGYRKNKDGYTTSRFGPIPIIGDLLGSRSRSKNRVELIIFLRPTVLTNTPADSAEALKRVETLEQKDSIKSMLDPNYVPPKKTLIDKVMNK